MSIYDPYAAGKLVNSLACSHRRCHFLAGRKWRRLPAKLTINRCVTIHLQRNDDICPESQLVGHFLDLCAEGIDASGNSPSFARHESGSRCHG